MNVHPRPHPGMAKISLFGIAAILMLAGIVAWASPTHSAVKDVIGPAPIDPLSPADATVASPSAGTPGDANEADRLEQHVALPVDDEDEYQHEVLGAR